MREPRRPKDKLLIPPTAFMGELIPWKGKWWKVQIYDQAGGDIRFQGETLGPIHALSQNPVIVLEMQGDTAGEMKRRKK